MNRDLEETLEELGPEYRGVVNRLRAAQEVSPAHSSARVQARIGLLSSAARVVAAAGLLAAACVAVAVKFGGPGASSVTPRGGSAAFTGEYSLAYTGDVESLLRTQNADGSWANDFLTRQNAAALRRQSVISSDSILNSVRSLSDMSFTIVLISSIFILHPG